MSDASSVPIHIESTDARKVIVVDDEQVVCDVLVQGLSGHGFDCKGFTDPLKALEYARSGPVHLAFVDVMMPNLNGNEFIKRLNAIDSDIAVVVMSGYGTVDIAVEAMKLGAQDFIAKPADIEQFAMSARIALERRQIRIESRDHHEKVERKLADSDLRFDNMHRDMEDSILQIVRIFSGFLDKRSVFVGNHSKRVAAACREVCRKFDLRDSIRNDIETAALLHDIGKIVISDALLAKTANFFLSAKLTEEERRIIRMHPVLGQEAVEMVSFLQPVSLIIRHHHETFNGTGYPDQLTGYNIPLGSRIIQVVDMFDKVIHGVEKSRVRDAKKFVVDHFRKNSGVLYDPDVVKYFLEMIEEQAKNLKSRKTKTMATENLKVGMTIAADLCTTGGVVLVSRDETVTPGDLSRIRRFLQRKAVMAEIVVYEEEGKTGAEPSPAAAPGVPSQEARDKHEVSRDDIVRFKKVKDGIDHAKDLGTLPVVYQNAMTLLNDPASNRRDIAGVLKQDQAIVTKVLRVVNSPLFAFSRRISTIEDAIPLLGFGEIKNIVTSVSVIASFPSGASSQMFDRALFWRHSAGCAIIAKVLARKFKIRSEEECFTAALVHDIGKLVFDQIFPDDFRAVIADVNGRNVSIREAERAVFGRPHQVVGEYLLRKWKIPDILCESVAYHHSPKDAKIDPFLVSVVHTADVLAHMMHIGESGEKIDPVIDDFACERLGFTSDALRIYVSELESAVKEGGDLLNLGD